MIRRVFVLPFPRSSRATARAVVVGVTSAALALAWVVPTFAAAPSAPSGLATEDVESQTPVLPGQGWLTVSPRQD